MSTATESESDGFSSEQHSSARSANAEPLLSIVVPCLDEEITIGEFVDWCFEGLKDAGIPGEVLIVDSSTDRSAEIAEEHGARVLRVPRRGLGRAYIDAVPHIRGQWVIMGDCDLTYDFRQIRGFVERLGAGDEFVMGTRTKGYIEPGAMPKLHRYFGSPATTWLFNRIYGTRFSDIHCGMRALTLDAYKRMQLSSQSWEYASEMILKAAKLGLRASEVPVRFYKDPPGRESHLVRGGWTQPWKAGWITIRVQVLYAPEYFLWWPGWILLVLGSALCIALADGPIGSLQLDWMLLGIVASVVGYSAVQLATLARVHYSFDLAFRRRVTSVLSYNRGMFASLVLLIAGLIPNVVLVIRWLSHHFRLVSISYTAVFGLYLLIMAFMTFAFTLLLHLMRDDVGAG
jgi:glycosyltransferase involved in cell wall biosynthesis